MIMVEYDVDKVWAVQQLKAYLDLDDPSAIVVSWSASSSFSAVAYLAVWDDL